MCPDEQVDGVHRVVERLRGLLVGLPARRPGAPGAARHQPHRYVVRVGESAALPVGAHGLRGVPRLSAVGEGVTQIAEPASPY